MSSESMKRSSVTPSLSIYESGVHSRSPVSKPEKTARISIVGTTTTGKSSAVLRYIHNIFPESGKLIDQDDLYTKQHPLDSNMSDMYTLQIMDTTGDISDDYDSQIRKLQILQSDAFILCYAVNDEESLNNLHAMGSYLLRLKLDSEAASQVPIIIAGMKADLVNEKVVLLEQVQEMARSLDICPSKDVIECSARTNYNINAVFNRALQRILEERSLTRPSTPDNTEVGMSNLDVVLPSDSDTKIVASEDISHPKPIKVAKTVSNTLNVATSNPVQKPTLPNYSRKSAQRYSSILKDQKKNKRTCCIVM